ncbi:hypothetical protein ABI59_08335 [Acidobacteria bacterium Mor1]|nr:hypothetical protein ABI59_08335 [Acidobacteria bacterium Mor1]
MSASDPYVFDEAFYRSRYLADAPESVDPRAHYRETGEGMGNMPNPRFDPLLYRMARPEAGDKPWEHFVAHRGEPTEGVRLTALFPEIDVPFRARHAHRVEELAVSDEVARGFSSAGELRYEHRGEVYRFRHPEPGFLLDRIEADEPFAFARVVHGVWDSIEAITATAERMSADPRLTFAGGEQLRALATRLCFERWNWSGSFVDGFLRELQADLESGNDDPGLLEAVAFKGFPTADGSVFPCDPPGEANLERFARFTRYFTAERTLYDATLWKRWAISGALGRLPELCREHPVVLIGPERLGLLGRRWQLPHFRHLSIPPANTQLMRGEVLAAARIALDRARASSSRKPVVLFQCGGSLACWFIRRLRRSHDDVFLLDLGQTLDIWFFDIPKPKVATWVKVYRDQIIEHCGLGELYAGRAID